jgi:HD-like signal output (HDOD) protein
MVDPHVKQALLTIHSLAKLPAWQFDVIAEVAEVQTLKKGRVLLERGDDDGFTYFLVEGQLKLEGGEGSVHAIEAGGTPQQMPVANLRPRIMTATAMSKVRTLRVPDIAISAAGCLDNHTIAVETQEEAARREAETRLSFELYRDLINDVAILPSLPDLAFRIRRAIEAEGTAARTVARLVESDPSMAAKLLKVANSAMYGGMQKTETCSGAVVRLGMQVTKQLVTSFALREVFRSKHPQLRQHMQQLWKHSSNIAAICFVLARQTADLEAEEALLIGLLHDVGTIAILNYIERYPELLEQEGGVELTIQRMRGELGAMILRQWQFPPAVIAGARDAEAWTRSHSGGVDFTDLLIVAQVHDKMRKHAFDTLPPLDDISAIGRVLGEGAGPERSVQILHDAKEQLDAMRSVLRG